MYYLIWNKVQKNGNSNINTETSMKQNKTSHLLVSFSFDTFLKPSFWNTAILYSNTPKITEGQVPEQG